MEPIVAMMVSLVIEGSVLLSNAQQVIGVVAAFLAAMIAVQGGWHLTDRLISLRERPEE